MGAGSSRPSINFNQTTNRWEVRTRNGKLKFSVADDGTIQAETNVKVGGGTAITKIIKGVGSNAAVAVGTGNMAVASIPFTGVAAGDAVFASAKAAILGSIGVAGFFASGDNNVNAYIINPMQTNGTFGARGWDLTAIRS